MTRSSIIIPNWNGKELLEECLTSLAKQTDQDFEIIVVDNGSSDHSVEFLATNFPQVRVIPLERNMGFAIACNTGIRQAKGDRIVLLNNDTSQDEHWLEELNTALDQHPEVGFCASKMLNYWKPSIIDTAGDNLGVARGFKRGHQQPDGPAYNKQEYIFAACAGAAIYRRQMLDQVGLFDESFGSNLEDMDLSFRAQLQGFKCLYVPTAAVYHKVGETKRKMGWSGRLNFRNNKYFWIKNAPLKIFCKYLPGLCLYDAKLYYGAIKRIFQYRTLESIKYLFILWAANMEVIFHLPSLLIKRHRIQKSKTVNATYIDEHIHIS